MRKIIFILFLCSAQVTLIPQLSFATSSVTTSSKTVKAGDESGPLDILKEEFAYRLQSSNPLLAVLSNLDMFGSYMNRYLDNRPWILKEVNQSYSHDSDMPHDLMVTKEQVVRSAKFFLPSIFKDFVSIGYSFPFEYFRNLKSRMKDCASRSKRSKVQTSQKGIVLIHGTGDGDMSYQWKLILKYLKRHNRDGSLGRVLVVKYASRDNRIKKSCKDIWEQIRSKFSAEEEVALIGHSQGGLIARAMVHHPECCEDDCRDNPRVSSVFSINAPLRGVVGLNASLEAKPQFDWHGTAYEDLQVGSQFIQELRDGIIASGQNNSQDGPKIFEIASECDAQIPPNFALTNAPNVEQYIHRNAGHLKVVACYKFWKNYLIPKLRNLNS